MISLAPTLADVMMYMVVCICWFCAFIRGARLIEFVASCSSTPLSMSVAEGGAASSGYSVALVTCPDTEAAKKLSRYERRRRNVPLGHVYLALHRPAFSSLDCHKSIFGCIYMQAAGPEQACCMCEHRSSDHVSVSHRGLLEPRPSTVAS